MKLFTTVAVALFVAHPSWACGQQAVSAAESLLQLGDNLAKEEAENWAGAAQMANSSMFTAYPADGRWEATFNPQTGGYSVRFYPE